MTIYVVKTFRGYWVTASEEEAELKANKMYDELKQESEAYRVKREDVWVRIAFYHAKNLCGAPFVFVGRRWVNAM